MKKIQILLFSFLVLFTNTATVSAHITCAGTVASQSIPKPKTITFLIEGFGDVTRRFYIPDLEALSEELEGKANYKIIFSDVSNPEESSLEKEVRLRRIEKANEKGFSYIDKRVSRETYETLKPDVVFLACPGKFYKHLLEYWLNKENPPRIYSEKPLADSLDSANDIMTSLPPFDSRFLAIDSYAYKIKRNKHEALKDIEWLGGIESIRFIATENRSGSDESSSTPAEFRNRDGAIERENRVEMISKGVGADFLSHFFASVRHYVNVSSLRPVEVYAFRYRGVDGDPNKETEVPRETLFHSTFSGVDVHGEQVKGQISVGKGIRVKEVGIESENNAKRFTLFGKNGRRIQFDLRGSGEGAGKAIYFEKEGNISHQTTEEKNPYRALFREILTNQPVQNTQSMFAEEAVLYRERETLFTRFISHTQLPLYNGGMGGAFWRPAPYLEEVLATSQPISAPKFKK